MKSSRPRSKYVTKKDLEKRCKETGGYVAVASLMHKVILRVKLLAHRRRTEVRRPYSADEHAKNRDRDNARTKKWVDNNKQKVSQKQKTYRETNREKLALKERLKYKSDPIFRLKSCVRARLRHFLRTSKMTKTTETFAMVGCSPSFLKQHLMQQLSDGRRTEEELAKHQIDHIFPLVLYSESEMSKMTHYSNLQPLLAARNNAKHSHLPTKAEAAKVDPEVWPMGVTMQDLPDDI